MVIVNYKRSVHGVIGSSTHTCQELVEGDFREWYDMRTARYVVTVLSFIKVPQDLKPETEDGN